MRLVRIRHDGRFNLMINNVVVPNTFAGTSSGSGQYEKLFQELHSPRSLDDERDSLFYAMYQQQQDMIGKMRHMQASKARTNIQMQVIRETQSNMALQIEQQQATQHQHMMKNFNFVHANQAAMLGIHVPHARATSINADIPKYQTLKEEWSTKTRPPRA